MELEKFKSFAKGGTTTTQTNKNVMVYTRVSTKEQADNYSLKNQEEAAEAFAKKNGYVITNRFGGTYESASGDFTRKEFTRLIHEVKKARKKPHAILIFIMSRFSRTGGSGIALAVEMVEMLGVHLIEVSTGDDTTTERGKLAIYNKLLKAREETLNKLEVSVPGMKKFLESGNWLGNVPRGYDQYGPRVKDITRIRRNQEIRLNEEGKLLQKAWEWKLQGEKDTVIMKNLESLGMKITKQQISKMWRNPFYCGICAHNMLSGRIVSGKWEKMVSEKDFLTIQEILKGNPQGYTHEKDNKDRPLNGHIKCSICGSKMVGYEVKAKGLHYYKCLKCNGVSINANSTQKSRAAGAHEMYAELLESYSLKGLALEPFVEQLSRTFELLNETSDNNKQDYQKKLDECNANIKKLNKRWALGEIDKDTYEEVKTDLVQQREFLNTQINENCLGTSNLKNYIEESLHVVQNIGKYWHTGNTQIKKKIQELVFPEGVSLDVKNRVYLTEKVNSLFALVKELKRDTEGGKKQNPENFSGLSSLVAGMRVELMTYGL